MYLKKYWSLGLVLLLAGCGYRMVPLKPLRKKHADYQQVVNGVSLRMQKLTKESVKECFDARIVPFKTTVPLLITLKNKSDNLIRLSKNNIGLPVVAEYEVYDRMRRSAIAAQALLKSIGWGAFCAALFSCDYRLFIGSTVALGVADIAGDVAYAKACQANDKLAVDLKSKVLDVETLFPGEKTTKVVFIDKSSYVPHFKLMIHELDKDSKPRNKPIFFNVKI